MAKLRGPIPQLQGPGQEVRLSPVYTIAPPPRLGPAQSWYLSCPGWVAAWILVPGDRADALQCPELGPLCLWIPAQAALRLGTGFMGVFLGRGGCVPSDRGAWLLPLRFLLG